MAEQRLTRKDMKEPDQFLSVSMRVFHWFQENVKLLMFWALGVMCLVGIFLIWSTWHSHREQKARTLFYEAKKSFDTSSRNPDTTDRRRAMAQFDTLVRDYGHTSVSALSYWYLGQLAFEGGDYTTALTSYQHAQRRLSHTANTPMTATVTLSMGYAQEATGKCDQAVPNFDTVLHSSAHWLRGEAYMGLGRCYRQAGDGTKLVTLSERVLTDKSLSELSRQNISEQLTFLKRQISELTN